MQNYRVFEKIKKTKECSYYNAENKQTKEIVTIKKLSNKYAWQDILNRKDITLMKQSKYQFLPNILQIIKDNNKFYIVFDKLTGNLDEFKNSRLQLQEILQITIKLLESIIALHKQNILLFDIRPQYYFYCNQKIKIGHLQIIQKKQIKQIDLVQFEDLKYRAPQNVLTAKKIDEKSNVFSITCIICQLLFQKPLINAKTKIDYMYIITELFPKQNLNNQERVFEEKESNTFENRIKKICGKQFRDILIDMLKIDKSERISAVQALERLKKLNRLQLKPIYENLSRGNRTTNPNKLTQKSLIDQFEHIFEIEQEKKKSIQRLTVNRIDYPTITQIEAKQNKTSSKNDISKINSKNDISKINSKHNQSFENSKIFDFQNQNDNHTIDRVIQMIKLTKPLKSERNVEDDVSQAIVIKKSDAFNNNQSNGELPNVKLQNLNIKATKKSAGRPQLTNFALNDNNLGVKLGSSFFNENENFPS